MMERARPSVRGAAEPPPEQMRAKSGGERRVDQHVDVRCCAGHHSGRSAHQERHALEQHTVSAELVQRIGDARRHRALPTLAHHVKHPALRHRDPEAVWCMAGQHGVVQLREQRSSQAAADQVGGQPVPVDPDVSEDPLGLGPQAAVWLGRSAKELAADRGGHVMVRAHDRSATFPARASASRCFAT